MSITFVNGVGTAIKGIILQVPNVYSGAVMPTIGPPNGTGKLYQPGTRGLVADDYKGNRPSIYLRTTGDLRHVTNPAHFGYAAVMHNTETSLSVQGGTTYLDSSLYGMSSYMLSVLNDDVNNIFYLPCPMTSNATYDVDFSRYGNKPITGTYSVYNQAGVRGIHTPAKTIYKWEAHVLVSVWNYSGGGNTASTAQAWMSRLTMVHIPAYANNMWYRFSLTLEKTHVPVDAQKLCLYKYYVGEFSGNMPGNTFIAAPVLELNGAGTSSSERRPIVYVQTKFCFKDD